ERLAGKLDRPAGASLRGEEFDRSQRKATLLDQLDHHPPHGATGSHHGHTLHGTSPPLLSQRHNRDVLTLENDRKAPLWGPTQTSIIRIRAGRIHDTAGPAKFGWPIRRAAPILE